MSTFFWDDLLEFMDERRVVPILGPELLRVPQEGGEAPLYRWLAEKLARKLNVPAENLPAHLPLNHVVCRFLDSGGQREDVYSRLRSVVKELKPPTPEPLRKLARIRHFNLYVSTTFDSLLEQALNEERFAGDAKALSLAYAPNSVQDLPCVMERLERPTVYQLLGRLSASPDYAVTEEDTLEFVSSLQSEARRPHLLFDELKNNHLLFIGCNFSGWLAKFFIRLAKSSRLSLQRSASEIVADGMDRSDSDLALFLKHFSYRTKIYPDGGAVEFVNELAARYERRHPPETVAPAVPASPAARRMDMAAGAIFLSYASQDAETVGQIRDALLGAGLDVWFDKAELQGGDFWNSKINRNIRNCSLFVPVISARTQQRLEGYFRLEWRWAAERSLQIAEGVPFIIPLVLGDVPQDTAIVPERFQAVQWTRLPDGKPAPDFVSLMVRHYRDFRKREKGLV
jgi:hypothetical protein